MNSTMVGGNVIEIAEIDVIAGHEDAFIAAVGTAAPHFKAAKGCRGLELLRSEEHPQRFRLIVGWDTVADHTQTFRQSEGFSAWRALAGPHFAGTPRVEHVRNVLKGF